MPITCFNAIFRAYIPFFSYLIGLYHPMKKITVAILLTLFCITTHAQQKKLDSLLRELSAANDPKQINSLFRQIHPLHGGDAILLKNARKNLETARSSNDLEKQELALTEICKVAESINDPPSLLDGALQGIRIGRNTKDDKFLGDFFRYAGIAYVLELDERHSIKYFLSAAKLHLAKNKVLSTINDYSPLETDYKDLKMPDSALYFARQELSLASRIKDSTRWEAFFLAYGDMGEALSAIGKLDSALTCFYKVIAVEQQHLHKRMAGFNSNDMAEIYMRTGKPDSAIKYALDAYDFMVRQKRWDYAPRSAAMLATLYESRDPQKSIFYLKAQLSTQDSLTKNDKIRQLQLVGDKEQQRQQELQVQQERFNSRIRLYVVITAAFVLLMIGLIQWRNNRRQKQTNHLLSEQKEEIEAQRDNLESALENLKTAQTQLVQAEKMASLGELTAGIAHEIQNPLNFVNNFSEVSAELIAELKEELSRGDIEEAVAIATDVESNLEKIHHHGKRADGIVKGMLQHSRASSGQKELTDLNALADEYLRLAYHGLRAKDKDFNAEIITRLDNDLPKVNMAPQDISRVLLNLFNNAFYAVSQKVKTAGPGYKPAVEVSTSQLNGSVIILVKDNGTGIPDDIRGKIMQPFFTTKPTGEGTGLGLSISYDIVVKGHGGKINITSEEGQGSEFTISLPATK